MRDLRSVERIEILVLITTINQKALFDNKIKMKVIENKNLLEPIEIEVFLNSFRR